jgi:hypothetical protein
VVIGAEVETVRLDENGFSPVRHDQLLLVPKNFLFNKQPYPLLLNRTNASNAGINSK